MSQPVETLVKAHGIGLTGGIATGKSVVARLIAAHGYLVVDADQLARAVVAPGTPGLAQIVATFGEAMRAADGSLDRGALRGVVFADPTARARLEAITHPLIRAALFDRLAQEQLAARPRPFFYEAALLFEAGRADEFHKIWATVCPPAVQRARLLARDAKGEADADRILASQMPAATKAARADLAIDTDCSLDELARRVDAALGTL